MVNQRQLNGGEQGDGSGLDADKVDNRESSELGTSANGENIIDTPNGLRAIAPIYSSDISEIGEARVDYFNAGNTTIVNLTLDSNEKAVILDANCVGQSASLSLTVDGNSIPVSNFTGEDSGGDQVGGTAMPQVIAENNLVVKLDGSVVGGGVVYAVITQ